MRLTDRYHGVPLSVEDPECAADPVLRYLGTDGEWKAGVRPPSVVETPADVEWLFAHGDTARPFAVCRWCGDRAQPTSVEAGVRWFVTHTCAQGLAA